MARAWLIIAALVLLVEGSWWAYTRYTGGNPTPISMEIRKVDTAWPRKAPNVELVAVDDPAARLWLRVEYELKGEAFGEKWYGLAPVDPSGVEFPTRGEVGSGINERVRVDVSPERFNESGFNVEVLTQWNNARGAVRHQEKSFRCRWQPEQEFTEDGMRLKVSLMPAEARPSPVF